METLLPLLELPTYGWAVVVAAWVFVEYVKARRGDKGPDDPAEPDAKG